MSPTTAWIIEDEPPALRRLTRLLAEHAPRITIAFQTDSIAPALRALKTLPQPDIIFSDIHLADGLAFDIWEAADFAGHLVFTTAYDQYALRAFRVNGLDYLLKPIEETDLRRALDRAATRPANSPPPPNWQDLARLIAGDQPVYRERFLAKKGNDWLPIPVADLDQIYTKDGLVFGLAARGTRLLLNDTLDRIEAELPPREWFRINRAQLVRAGAIVRASPYFNHRLKLELRPAGELENLVSRAKVKEFQAWLGG